MNQTFNATILVVKHSVESGIMSEILLETQDSSVADQAARKAAENLMRAHVSGTQPIIKTYIEDGTYSAEIKIDLHKISEVGRAGANIQ